MTFTRKTILGAAVAMAFSAAAYADPISFNPYGTGAGGATNLTSVDVFDWLPGSALAVAPVPITAVGQNFMLYYQANLGVVVDNNAGGTPGLNLPVFTNGTVGSPYAFTAVAGFGETVTAFNNTTGTASFGLNAAAPSFFYICKSAGNTSFGNNLTGVGFGCAASDRILTATVSAVSSSNFDINETAAPELLDQNDADDWAGQLTVVGTGSTDITATITGWDSNFFTDFTGVQQLLFSFFNTSQVLPFKQVDPSKCFTTDGADVTAACDTANAHVPTLGVVNGLFTGTAPLDFIFQADANQSFIVQRVPEPASLALFGAALAVAGFVGRRRKVAS